MTSPPSSSRVVEEEERRSPETTTHAQLKTIDCGVDGDGVIESKGGDEMADQNKRINSSIVKSKNAEVEAATKIQASFRGYQVRKQLKQKVSHLFLPKEK